MANPEHLEILYQGVEAWNTWRLKNTHADLSDAALTPFVLNGINFSGINLKGADFNESEFVNANFAFADLKGATFTQATLRVASFTGANLSGANLSHAMIALANFNEAKLIEANLSGVSLWGAVFGDNDLSEVQGLESIRHFAPSSIGIDTIYKSRGNIPEVFLRGCGVPEDFITYMRSLVGKALEFYSCFISYSSEDEEFARRLYADLQNEGVRCWFAPEDLKIGDKLRVRIDESIRLYDKLLLVLSENSVASEWVEKEVETALEKEREQGKVVLFPVRLDDSVFEIKTGWAADIKRTRHIGDFREWKQHDSYRQGFERLVRDLKAEAGREV